jgi:hypothetical protein
MIYLLKMIFDVSAQRGCHINMTPCVLKFHASSLLEKSDRGQVTGDR